MVKNRPSLRSYQHRIVVLLVTLSLSTLLAACGPAAQAPAAPVAAQPTEAPTLAPVATEAPTLAPVATEAPTLAPVATEAPTLAPVATEAPTLAPTATEAPTETPAAAPVQSAATFAADVRPILDQRCLNCHGGKDGTRGRLSLKTYEDLMKGGESGAAIAPGDPANSLLVELIESGEMPRRAPKLPQSEIDIIIAWVTAGAKND